MPLFAPCCREKALPINGDLELHLPSCANSNRPFKTLLARLNRACRAWFADEDGVPDDIADLLEEAARLCIDDVGRPLPEDCAPYGEMNAPSGSMGDYGAPPAHVTDAEVVEATAASLVPR